MRYLPHVPRLWAEPTTQACALTENRTYDLLAHGTILTEPHQPGVILDFD